MCALKFSCAFKFFQNKIFNFFILKVCLLENSDQNVFRQAKFMAREIAPLLFSYDSTYISDDCIASQTFSDFFKTFGFFCFTSSMNC